MDRSRRLAILLGTAALAASAAGPIKLHPKNPHYFEFRGKAHVLLTSGEHYGAVLNSAFDYQRYLETLAADGLKTLVNFGPGEEGLAGAVETASGGTAETFTGSLTQLIALTRRARLFIGGDTGPMHLAAALGIPVVGIFGPTDPARNGPFGVSSIVLRSSASNTSYSHVLRPDDGLLEITAEQVVAAAHQLLGEHHG